ncbi:MAG: TRCF domain-containing protein, partial [Tannerellaceae bacterium]
AFVSRLEDRFGKIPQEGKELIRIVRLRRMARSLGIEKLVLKNNRMSIHFISNMESPYFQSAAFTKILNYVQSHPKLCHFKEHNGKHTIQIKPVTTVETACAILDEMLSE